MSDAEPQRHGAGHDDRDHRRPHQDPVGGGVEDLAQGGHLVPAPGHEAVDPVGGPEHGQEDGRRRLAVGAEEQPHEHGHAGQADSGDGVGDREDAVFALLVTTLAGHVGAPR